MKLVFIGADDPTEADECVAYGIVFPRGKAVTVSGELFELLAPNPAFKAVPGKRAAAEQEGTD